MKYRYPRHALGQVERALGYARVVLLLGPRQSGKSTLATEALRLGLVRTLLDFDDDLVRGLAEDDPSGLLAEYGPRLAIDEVQRVPELMFAVKRVVDRDDSPGQFLLTGSANVLTAPRVLDALTGRTDIVNLWPLEANEIEGESSYRNLVDRIFDGDPPLIRDAAIGRTAWIDRSLAGGFPEALRRPDAEAREAWFTAYITSLVNRDLRELADAEHLNEIPNLLRSLAGQVGSTVVVDRLSQRVGLSRTTISRYLGLLETLFLLQVVPAWRPGVAGRERRAPKIMFADTGLLAHLLEADAAYAVRDSHVTGALFENFVTMELIKQAAWAKRSVVAQHYKREGREVDLILESRSGDFIAIEAKASSTVGRNDRRALVELRDARPDRFLGGVVIYSGSETVPLSKGIWAVPVSALWRSER